MNKRTKLMKLLGSDWGQRLTLLAIIFVVMAIVEPKFFLPSNILSIMLSVAYYGIMACGMLFCVMVGGIDLSVGSMAALSGTVFALTVSNFGEGPGFFALAIILGLLVGVLVGFLHGVFDVYLHMPAFVVTYATQYGLYGLAQELTNLEFIRFDNLEGLVYKLGNMKILGVQTPIIFFVVIALITAVVYEYEAQLVHGARPCHRHWHSHHLESFLDDSEGCLRSGRCHQYHCSRHSCIHCTADPDDLPQSAGGRRSYQLAEAHHRHVDHSELSGLRCGLPAAPDPGRQLQWLNKPLQKSSLPRR